MVDFKTLQIQQDKEERRKHFLHFSAKVNYIHCKSVEVYKYHQELNELSTYKNVFLSKLLK